MIRKLKESKIKLVILFGPPGAGKGTQAELLVDSGFIHVETSKLLEKIVRSDNNSQFVKRLKNQFFSGKLLDPRVVSRVLSGEIKTWIQQGRKIVLSGSPRTIYEARVEMPLFKKLFSKSGIAVFIIKLSEGESIKRNSNRRICSVCRFPVPNFKKYKDLKNCLKCGAKLIKRELDKPEIIKKRLIEYKKRTEPIISFLKKQGFKIIKIKGNQLINKVHQDIAKFLK